MKLRIEGSGSFGSFLKELLAPHFDICDDADSVILAVPISAYDECGVRFSNKHIINVCSVQKPSTDILLQHADRVTSIHPLFGKRTPANKRNSIHTHSYTACNDTWLSEDTLETDFLNIWSTVSTVQINDGIGQKFTPDSHDALMALLLLTTSSMLQAVMLVQGGATLTGTVQAAFPAVVWEAD